MSTTPTRFLASTRSFEKTATTCRPCLSALRDSSRDAEHPKSRLARSSETRRRHFGEPFAPPLQGFPTVRRLPVFLLANSLSAYSCAYKDGMAIQTTIVKGGDIIMEVTTTGSETRSSFDPIGSYRVDLD